MILPTLAVLLLVLVVWLTVEVVRDHRNPNRDRAPKATPARHTAPATALVVHVPEPNITDITVQRFRRRLAAAADTYHALEDYTDQIEAHLAAALAELDICQPADPIARYLRDNGPASTLTLMYVLALQPSDAHRRLTSLSEVGVITEHRQHGQTIWTHTTAGPALPTHPHDPFVVDAELETIDVASLAGLTVTMADPRPPILEGAQS